MIAATRPAFASEPSSTEEHRALMISAQVVRKEGKLLRSRDLLSTCATNICSADQSAECEQIRAFCGTRLADVSAEIPTIVLRVEDDRGMQISAERLELDSATVYSSKPIATDPGPHAAKVLYAGRNAETNFTVTASQKNVPVTIRLDLRQTVHLRPTPIPVYALGIVTLASGVLALSTGIYTAHQYSDLDSCQPYCDPSNRGTLKTTGAIADISTLVALGSAIAGTIWFFARPTESEVRRVDAGHMGEDAR